MTNFLSYGAPLARAWRCAYVINWYCTQVYDLKIQLEAREGAGWKVLSSPFRCFCSDLFSRFCNLYFFMCHFFAVKVDKAHLKTSRCGLHNQNATFDNININIESLTSNLRNVRIRSNLTQHANRLG